MMRVKKKDQVLIISGKDKGKKGEVIEILPKKGKLKVKGVAIATRHVKPKKAGELSGIIKSEAFIPLSKVMPVCKSCDKSTRIAAKMLENGTKARSCKRCGEIF